MARIESYTNLNEINRLQINRPAHAIVIEIQRLFNSNTGTVEILNFIEHLKNELKITLSVEGRGREVDICSNANVLPLVEHFANEEGFIKTKNESVSGEPAKSLWTGYYPILLTESGNLDIDNNESIVLSLRGMDETYKYVIRTIEVDSYTRKMKKYDYVLVQKKETKTIPLLGIEEIIFEDTFVNLDLITSNAKFPKVLKYDTTDIEIHSNMLNDLTHVIENVDITGIPTAIFSLTPMKGNFNSIVVNSVDSASITAGDDTCQIISVYSQNI